MSALSLPASTDRYARKKDAIIAAAAETLNVQGIKGMTLADVAAKVGLSTTSVTYYFRKKEDLAAACLLSAIDRVREVAAEAAVETTTAGRVMRLIEGHLERYARMRNGAEPSRALFNDVRALTPPKSEVVFEAYNNMFRHVRTLFDTPEMAWLGRAERNARTHTLIEQMNWMSAWLPAYDTVDYGRIGERMFDILSHGLAADGSSWAPEPSALAALVEAEADNTAATTFLVAATALVNEQGYRGASVDKISARLGVTKGSFYHHNDAKDDLVAACFDRSFDIIRRMQLASLGRGGSYWTRLSTAAAALVRYQLSPHGPLLRSSAVSALPQPLQPVMFAQSDRVAQRFAGMISDGVAEGTIRPVDPFIAAQMITSMINSTADLPLWVRGVTAEEAPDLFARPLLLGSLKAI